MEISEDSLFQSVKEIISQSHEKVFRIANSTLLFTYWQIGKLIIEDEQQRKKRAESSWSHYRLFPPKIVKSIYLQANICCTSQNKN